MSSLGDDEPAWEVFQHPVPGGDIERYRPPASDSPDPVTVSGRDRDWRQRAMPVIRAMYVAAFVGGPLMSLGPRSVGWYTATGTVMVAIVLVMLVRVLRKPSAPPPEVTADAEGLTVADVHGITRRTAWSEIENVYLGWYANRRVRELYVSWVTPTGENVVTNLGKSLELEDVRGVLAARAPATVSLRVGREPDPGQARLG